MQRIFGLVILSALAAAAPAHAANPNPQTPQASFKKKVYTAEESAALGAAAQRRAEARQKEWDRRLNQISGSICTGC
jgi:hypothetical protein